MAITAKDALAGDAAAAVSAGFDVSPPSKVVASGMSWWCGPVVLPATELLALVVLVVVIVWVLVVDVVVIVVGSSGTKRSGLMATTGALRLPRIASLSPASSKTPSVVSTTRLRKPMVYSSFARALAEDPSGTTAKALTLTPGMPATLVISNVEEFARSNKSTTGAPMVSAMSWASSVRNS